MRRIFSIVIAIVAVVLGIVSNCLPKIIDKLVAIENDSPGLERLRIGHAMAGGGSEGSEAMADAMKTMLLSKAFGVKTTSSREAWRRFANVIRDAEKLYLSPSWGFGLGPAEDAANEIAEGLRYVSHVTKFALDVFLEESPRFVRMVSPTLKLLGDNPDAIYHFASLRSHGGPVHAKKEFEIEGCRGEKEVYFSFSIHAPSLSGGAFERVITDVNDDSIDFDRDGCYKLYLSQTNPGEGVLQGATWLETPEDASSLVTRNYFSSWPPGALHENVQLSIQLRQAKDQYIPEPVTDAVIAQRIDLASDFIRRHTILMPQPDPTTAPPFFALLPNSIGIPQKWKKGAEGMGAVDIAYAAGRFRLEENEALILEGAVPRCRFANVVLWNRYLQTFDYTAFDDYPVFFTLDTPADGADSAAFSIVLSKTRPATSADSESLPYKWMFTEGRAMGTVFFRFLMPEGDQYEYHRINTTVVSVDKVAEHFSRTK